MKATTPQTQDRLEQLADDHACAQRLVDALDADHDREAVTPQDVLTMMRIEPALAAVAVQGQALLTYAPTEDGTAEYLVVGDEDVEDDEEFETVGRRRASALLRSGDVALGLTHEPDQEREESPPRIGGDA